MANDIPKRILDYPETTELSDGDYVLLDSVANGSRKFKANKLGGGGSSDVVNPVYNWWANPDKTLVVREKISDGTFRWYFNNYTVTTASSPFMPIPSNLARFTKNGTTAYCYYNDGYDYGQIGFYEDSIRLWLSDLSLNVPGSGIQTIIESTYTGFNNPYTWEEPTFDIYNG